MELNRAKLIKALSSIDNPGVSKLRTWDTSYRNKTATYWNSILWKKILEHQNIYGSRIDRYDFYNFCGYYCSNEESRKIFNMINQKSRSILFNEFENFLEKIDNIDYDNIMDSLEEIYIPVPEPELQFNIAIEPEIESEPLPESVSEIAHESQSLPETDSKHQSHPISIPASEPISRTVPDVESDPITETVSKVAVETEVQPLVLSEPLSVQNQQPQPESKPVSESIVESLLEPLLESPPLPQPESKQQPESSPFYVEIFNKIKSFFRY